MPEAASLRSRLERRWYGATAPCWLRPLAAVYGCIVRMRRAAYARGWLASRHPGVPVIVVGNLTVGGTGKTPLVIWLATALRDAGRKPGVVLRGYRGSARAARLVAAADDPAVVGDEAVLIARRAMVPVATGTDRAAAAELLVRQGCTVLLSDDGLQHLALRRDLQVVVVDGERGFGNGSLLPAGPLREPAAMLDTTDLLVIHGEDRRDAGHGREALRMTLQPEPLRQLGTGTREPLQALRGETLHAVAGIGNPQRFFAMLRELGARPVEHAFADHHRYSARDLAFDGAARIVMTEKDAVKCAALATGRAWYLPVSAHLPDDDARLLMSRVLAIATRGGDGSA